MRFFTKLRVFGLRELRNRYVEKAQMAVAWRVPRWLAYWCFIRVWANATTGEFGYTEFPAELSAVDTLKRWEKK